MVGRGGRSIQYRAQIGETSGQGQVNPLPLGPWCLVEPRSLADQQRVFKEYQIGSRFLGSNSRSQEFGESEGVDNSHKDPWMVG